MHSPKDIPHYDTAYIDKVLKEASEDDVTSNQLLLNSVKRIFKQREKEKRSED